MAILFGTFCDLADRSDNSGTSAFIAAVGKATQLEGIEWQHLGWLFRVRSTVTLPHQPFSKPTVGCFALLLLIPVTGRGVFKEANLLRRARRSIQISSVFKHKSHSSDWEALILRGRNAHDWLRRSHCQQLMIVCVTDQSGNKMAMLRSAI